jgi:tetratricopeptide (TPR) repeat protein
MQDLTELMLADAIAYHQAGHLAEAERLYHEVIKKDPRHISALYRLAVLYIQNDQAQHALPFLADALKLQPRNHNILSSLGVASQMTGRAQEAVSYFRQALTLKPGDIGILGNLGRALREQRNAKAALECFVEMAEASPDNPDISLEIGRCHYEMERFDDAVRSFEKALHQRPDHGDALSALSAALWAIGQRGASRAKLEYALRIAPNDTKTILNFGEFLAFDEGKIDEALAYFNRALALAPDYNAAMWRKSFALLARGEYREGWRLYAACLGSPDTRGINKFAPLKPWDGTYAPDKRLLIWCEQGLGDSLHFIRYAALCKQRVGKVSVFCQKPLVRLFHTLSFIDDASDICDRNSFDEHIPIMSLPHIFDTTLETIPAAPYLEIDSSIQAKWSAKFEDTSHTLKVGLVWAGGAHEDNVIAKITDRQRSVKLESMLPWLGLQGVKFYSLQKDKPSGQIGDLGLTDRITNFMDEVEDFTDTAAIIQNLDLVITVDTAVAHLAGALGKPVWIMSRYNADWRWLRNKPDSPWYPTARIFGQPEMGDWDSVIAQIKGELASEIIKKKNP